MRNLVDQTVARFGRLDAAVNCAGTEGRPGPVTQQTADSYAATFDTNVLGTLLSMKHELRVMLAQRSGSIVNVSSTYGHAGTADASVYCRQQARGRGAHHIRGARGRGLGRSRQCGSTGPTDTGMLNRFTGNAERKAGLVSTVPLGRVRRRPTRSPTPSCFFASRPGVLYQRPCAFRRWREVRG